MLLTYIWQLQREWLLTVEQFHRVLDGLVAILWKVTQQKFNMCAMWVFSSTNQTDTGQNQVTFCWFQTLCDMTFCFLSKFQSTDKWVCCESQLSYVDFPEPWWFCFVRAVKVTVARELAVAWESQRIKSVALYSLLGDAVWNFFTARKLDFSGKQPVCEFAQDRTSIDFKILRYFPVSSAGHRHESCSRKQTESFFRFRFFSCRSRLHCRILVAILWGFYVQEVNHYFWITNIFLKP